MEGIVVHMGSDDASVEEYFDRRYANHPLLILDDLDKNSIKIYQS